VTLPGLAGIEAPAAMEGADRSGLLCGTAEGPDSVFLAGDAWRAVRTDRYTDVRVDTDREAFAHVPGGRAILWDNESDPCQYRNVVLRPEYADVVERLDATLEEWLERVGDPFLSGDALIEYVGMVEEDAERRAYRECVAENGRVPPGEWPPEGLDVSLDADPDG